MSTTMRRSCALFVLSMLVVVPAAMATPNVDGTINGGEYTYNSGNWSLAWDDTYLYVAHAGTEQVALYLDIDPQATPTAGANANGNLTGFGDGVAGTTGTITPTLPFRGDARALSASAGASLQNRNGSGGWTNATSGASIIAASSTGREMRITWTSLPGLTGRPASFRWFGYEMKDDGSLAASLSDPTPAANPTGTAASPVVTRFFEVTSTASESPTDPFSQTYATFQVTSNDDTGTGTLRDAITNSNADGSMTRRFITFNMPSTTIQLASNLPQQSHGGITIDGTTQPGFVSTPIVVIRGTSATDSVTPSYGMHLGGSSVYATYRGLIVQNAYYGLYSTDGFTATLENCWFGIAADGVTPQPNGYGVYLSDWDNSVIKNSVFSGNTVWGAYLLGNGPSLNGNIFGLGADGLTTVSNSRGLRVINGTATIGTEALGGGNVFAGLVGDAISIENSWYAVVWSNKIGVAANGTTARSNSGAGVSLTDSLVWIGDINVAERSNVIANNNGGVTVVKNSTRGVLVAQNSMYSNSSHGISVSGTTAIQPTPTISSAKVDGSGNLTVTYSLTHNPATTMSPQRIRLDLYDADPASPTVPQGKTRRSALACFEADTDLVNQTFAAGNGFSTGDKIVLVATSLSNGHCNEPGDGSSPFSAIATVQLAADKVFTGPGLFSEAAKWSGGTLPTAGQSIQIVGACTFDSAAPVLAYGALFLGNETTSGSIAFAASNPVALQVSSVQSLITGGAIDMTNGGTFNVSGTWNTSNMTFTRGTGTVEFSGSSQTFPALTYSNVSILGSISSATGTAIVANTLSNSGTFNPGGGTVELHGSLTGGGSTQFHSLTAPDLLANASSSFSVNSQFIVNGKFSPSASVVISGTGTLSGTGTIVVTGSSLSTQYTLTRDISAAEVEFGGTSLDALNYDRLRITGNATLAGTVTANDLYLTGMLTTGANSLTVNDTVTSLGGWIIGKLTRSIVSSGTYNFPVGTASFSMPVSATFNGVVAGTVTFGATAGEHPQLASSGINSARNVNGYWTFVPGTATYSNFAVTLTFNSNYDGTATPTGFVLRAHSSSAWSNLTATPAATSISASGITTAAQTDFAAGNGIADHYSVTAASPQTAGVAFLTTVTLVDAFGVTVPDSSTVVTMSASVPRVKFDSNGNGTFNDDTKALSNGSFTILTRDSTAETVTITATDGTGKTGTSSAIVILGPASAANTTISANPTSITANGTSTSTITVQAKDSNSANLVTGGDTVTLATNRGTLSAVTDNNNGTYTATLTSSASAGTATITGTINGGNITATATVMFVPGSATTLSVSAPSTAVAGSAFNITVTARDANANIVTSYTGTVHFTSSDGGATLPADYTFIGSDNGVHTFSVTLNALGTVSVTATDTVTAINGSANVAVAGATTTTLQSSLNPSQAGQSVTFTATVTSTAAGTITGTVTFKDGSSPIGTGTISSGTATFTTSSLSVATHSITAVYEGSTNFNTSTSAPLSQVVNSSSFGAPVFFSATASGTSQVILSWASVSSATSYRIYRSTGGSAYMLFDSTANTAYADNTVSANTTYVYKVSAFDGTTESALSLPDAATTIVFTDPSISGVVAKGIHVTELRTAVNAMRAAALLSPQTFTDSSLPAGSYIRLVHITELRTALNAARSSLGLPAISYTDPTLTALSSTMKAAHVTELRSGTQ